MIGRVAPLLLAGLLLTGCVTGPPAGPPPPAGVAAVARDRVYLTLPVPPGYPGETEIAQSIVASYGPRKVAIDALVSLSPAKVTIIVTAPAGPRVAQIDWDGAAWLVASESTIRRNAGFWIFLFSNVLWIAWAAYAAAPALIVLQLGLAAMNIRGAVKTARAARQAALATAADQVSPS